MDNNPNKNDDEKDEHTKPGIPRPGEQPDQQQQPFAPPQPESQDLASRSSSSQWTVPRTGNPDLDPACFQQGQRIDLRDPNPLVPQGMIFDPRQLLDQQRRSQQPPSGGYIPPGARFDPFGPPDPSLVGPGRGPFPDSTFGNPDPDHFAPPGLPQMPRNAQKGPKDIFRGPPGSQFPPPGGAGGAPFL